MLILVVCALFVANSATAAVRGRRQELGVLAALGWTRPRLFVTVVGEVALTGLTAGILGALLSLPLAAALGLHASPARGPGHPGRDGAGGFRRIRRAGLAAAVRRRGHGGRGRRAGDLRGAALAAYRRTVGFVFQRYHLLPALIALDNVIAPVLPYRTGWDKAERGRRLLEAVGLGERERSLPSRMSGVNSSGSPSPGR